MNPHAFPDWKIPQFANRLLFRDGSKVQNRSDLYVGGRSFRLHLLQPEFGSNGGYEREKETGVAR